MTQVDKITRVHDIVKELIPYDQDGVAEICKDCVGKITAELYDYMSEQSIRFTDQNIRKIARQRVDWASYKH